MSTDGGSTVAKAGAKTKVDLYGLLGVQKSSTEKQITAAYRKLALKFHPDRNQGSEEAAEKFKELSTAYAILSDPNKRRQYDLTGESPDLNGQGYDSIDLENLGGMGRVFGAMMGKLGIPIPTQIGPTTLSQAKEMCSAGLEAPDTRVRPLVWGHSIDAFTERQQGQFFLLTVSESDAESGMIINCCSNNRSRFKLVVFDQSGGVLYVQESSLTFDKKHTVATHYLVPFTTTTLREPLPAYEQEVPAVFTRLSVLDTHDFRRLDAGRHLICVYGDNFLQRTYFTLTATLADLTAPSTERVKEMDTRIRQKQKELEALQEQFTDLKERFEAICKKVEEETKQTDVLVQEREAAYHEFIDASRVKTRGIAPPPPSPPSDVSPSGGRAGIGGFFSDLLGGGSRK